MAYKSEVMKVIMDRKDVHGDSYKLMGSVIHLLKSERPAHFEKLLASEVSWCWLNAIAKLVRAMFKPLHEDHWIDAMGYCELALRLIRKDVAAVHEDEVPTAGGEWR